MTRRVLVLAPDPALRLDQQGGAGTHLRGTVDGLRAAGFAVTPVIGSTTAGDAGLSLAQRPAPVARKVVPAWVRPIPRDLRTILHGRQLSEQIDGTAFDCVYERSAYLLDVGLRVARRAGIPYVVESDGMLVEFHRETYGNGLDRYARRVERRKHVEADLVVTMAEPLRRRLVERYGLDPERILVKGLGVERSLLEAESGPPGDRPLVGFAGTFQPYHGIDVLIAALPRLAEAGMGALLIGDGPGLAAARERARGLPVTFTGLLDRADALRELSRCSVLAIPASASEMYPVKLLEYAALRRPVVCPAYEAYEEFRDGDRPLVSLFEAGSSADFARAVIEAAEPEGQAVVDGLHDLVAKEYTWDAVAARLGRALEELCSA